MWIFPEPLLIVKGGIFAVGFIVLCLSASLYITADMGVSTYDAVALIVCETWHKGKFKYVRIISDLTCVVLGSLIILISGGKINDLLKIVGLGTILTAFFMGPVIELFNKYISRPILHRYILRIKSFGKIGLVPRFLVTKQASKKGHHKHI